MKALKERIAAWHKCAQLHASYFADDPLHNNCLPKILREIEVMNLQLALLMAGEGERENG